MEFIVKLDSSIAKIISNIPNKDIPVFNYNSGYLPIGKADVKYNKNKLIAKIILDDNEYITKCMESLGINFFQFNINGIIKVDKIKNNVIDNLFLTDISICPKA